MPSETVGRTLGVALLLCLICSALVTAAAVALRPGQERNKVLEIRRNILVAAGLGGELDGGEAVEALFAQRIEARLVDLATGAYVEGDARDFDARAAAKSPATGIAIAPAEDIAGLKRRAKLAPVYLVREGDRVSRIILPVQGKGLWSTLYGFVAVRPDTVTLESLSFYEHGETPGLGGEVDNPRWQALWPGKVWRDKEGKPVIDVIKGRVNPADPKAASQVDGLSGATLTSNGVENLLRYWAGRNGFGPYLDKLREAS